MNLLFPSDPNLPHLWTLLDEGAMGDLVQGALGLEIQGCRPKYVRYKPETSCIVQYDLTLLNEAVGSVTLSAHIKVYSDGQAHRKASGKRATRLMNRTAFCAPSVKRIAFIAEVDGVLQVYPADLDLRDLSRLAQRSSARKLLGKALQLPESPRLGADPELVRYKPGRKALLYYRLLDGSEDGLYGKVFKGDRGPSIQAQTNALIEAGVRTAAVIGGVSESHFIVHEVAEGEQLASLRGTDAYFSWMEPLADALWQLQRVDVPGLPLHRLADEIDTLHQVTDYLGHIVPHLSQRFERVDRIVGERLSHFEDMLTTTHGDFYDDQALVSPSGVSIIDLEALRRSHPLLDAGNMLAHLSAAQLRGEESGSAHERFLEETQRHLNVDEQTVALFEAASLLKLVPGPFRRLEPDWQDGIERLLELAEARLPGLPAPNGIAHRPVLRDIDDPKLPQLGQLLNPQAMSETFVEHPSLSAASLERIELVRHKPGRRAILRFDLADNEVLYGKTYASNRGAKVYRVAQLLASSSAFGPDALVPEPVAWLPDSRLLLIRELYGIPIEDRLLEGDTDLVTRIAFVLHHLHSSDIDLGRMHDLNDELRPLESRVDEVARYSPESGAAACGVLNQVFQIDPGIFSWRNRAVHRDMYHDQILVAKDHLVILDLDDASMSDPAVDVANFVAHLMLLGVQRQGGTDALRNVIDAFLNQYRELDRDLDERLLSYLKATTLLRLAGIHVSRKNGAAVAAELLETSRSELMNVERMIEPERSREHWR